MAPSAIVEPQTSHFTGVSPEIEILPLPARTFKTEKPEAEIPVRVPDLFKSALVEQNRMGRRRRPLDVLVSVVLHVIVLSIPLFFSLYYTDTLNIRQFTATLLVAPPPPPPPPAAAMVVRTVAPKRVFMNQGKLTAPRYIPVKIAQIKEAPIPDSDLNGVAGGVPGGVPGGQMGGVIGGVIGSMSGTSIPLAPVGRLTAPIRVGGRIKAPRAIYNPPPQYPLLARQAHVSGIVVVDAVLDEKGNVVEMKVLSGPPLLYAAALNALKDWKYEPTYLNEAPIPVQMVVTITFQLNANANY